MCLAAHAPPGHHLQGREAREPHAQRARTVEGEKILGQVKVNELGGAFAGAHGIIVLLFGSVSRLARAGHHCIQRLAAQVKQ